MFGRIKKNKKSFGRRGLKKYSRSTKNYSNPFFEKKKKRSQRNNKPVFSIKIKIIISIFLFCLFFLLWFLFYSNYFAIKTIEGRGAGRIDPRNIEKIAWSQISDSDFILWQQKNIFIFNKKELIKTLNLKFSFNDIIITKKLPDKIIIKFDEKQYSLVWLEKGIYYYIDAHGYVVDRIGDTSEEKDYPLIQNNTSFFIASNRISIDIKFLDYIFLLIDKIKNYNDLIIDRFLIDNNSNTLKVQIENGPQLFFDINSDIDKQLNKIITLKNEILKEDFYKKEYIDVRIGDRVYHR